MLKIVVVYTTTAGENTTWIEVTGTMCIGGMDRLKKKTFQKDI